MIKKILQIKILFLFSILFLEHAALAAPSCSIECIKCFKGCAAVAASDVINACIQANSDPTKRDNCITHAIAVKQVKCISNCDGEDPLQKRKS